jgi:hypothetical protein
MLAFGSGCATTQTVTLGSRAPPRHLTTACMVSNRIDYPNVDNAIRRSLSAHGVVMRDASRCDTRSGADVVVEHHEVWQWNVVTYLSKMDVRLNDPVDGTLIASAQWNNSAVNSYENFDRVADKLIDMIFDRLAKSDCVSESDRTGGKARYPSCAGGFVGGP